jgi:methionyl-tRNA formyltransferase
VDVLLNVHSLWLIDPGVLDAPRIGAFNLHPAPLPEYAGLNGPSWAIYNGEPRHAVTVHWMAPGIDTGPIAYRQEIVTDDSDTGLTLSAKCVRAGVPLLLELLDAAARDPATIPRLPQDPARRHYYGKGVPEEGRLRWDRSADRIVRFVRACDYSPLASPWGHPRAMLDGRPIGVVTAFRTWRASSAPPGTVGDVAASAALVAAADEWVAVSRLAIDGHAVRAADILEEGARLEDGR